MNTPSNASQWHCLLKCDFCGCYIVKGHEICVHGPSMSIAACDEDGSILGGWSSHDNWAACPDCHDKLIKRDYQSIIDRILAGEDPDSDARAIITDMLTKVYSELSIIE